MKRSVLVKQHDITDCGAACLASVAAWHKRFIPIARIRQYAGTDQKGTNILGMVEAAEKLGFEAKGARGQPDVLSKIPLPAIAHFEMENGWQHFVVIYKFSKKKIRYMDPAHGQMVKTSPELFCQRWTGVIILLIPKNEFKAGSEMTSATARFWQLVRPYKFVMLQALFGAMVFTILGLSTSIYVQKIVDFVLVDGNVRLLNLLGLIMLFILCFQFFIGFGKSLLTLRTGQHIDARLILGYYRHLLSLPQKFFDTMRVGEIMSRLNDAVKIRYFINDVASSLLVNIFMILSAISLMFIYHWKLAMLMFLVFPLYGGLFVISHYVNKKWQLKLMQDSAELEAQLVESLQNINTVRQLNLEHTINEKTESFFVRLMRSVYTVSIKSLWIGNLSDLMTRLFTVIILWVGSFYVINGGMSPGELLSFYALIGYFTSPAVYLIGANKMIQEALIAARRLYEIIDLETEDQQQALPGLPISATGFIEFKNLSFSYSPRAKIFNSLNLKMPLGAFSAIVGESGSGKSTLMYLLQNLYPINDGAILLGTMDIRSFHSSQLRRLISIVPQRTEIFSGSIAENICIGDHLPDYPKMMEVTEQLGMHDFFSGLPLGYNTLIGERGINLSGGQLQRLAIARALYRNPQILILDEPSSALDNKAEAAIMSAIRKFADGSKTVILITHRKATLSYCDHIFHLQNGKILEFETVDTDQEGN